MLLKQREQEAAEVIEEQEINNAKAEQMPQVAENKLKKIKNILNTCKREYKCEFCDYFEDCASCCDDLVLKIIEE